MEIKNGNEPFLVLQMEFVVDINHVHLNSPAIRRMKLVLIAFGTDFAFVFSFFFVERVELNDFVHALEYLIVL